MAIPFWSLRQSVLLILYDFMLTSDHEGFWYGIPAIQEALPPTASGAFLQRALDALMDEKLVEQGGSDVLKKDLFALTEHGIRAAEELLEKRGIKIEEYEPAPDSDLLLTRIDNPEVHTALNEGLEKLKVEISRSNSFDLEVDGNGDLVESDINAAVTLMSAQRVRISRLMAILLPTLRYLVKKFADQSIGEIAKKLIALLLGMEL